MTAKIQKMNPSDFSHQDKGKGGDGWKKVSKAIQKTFIANSRKSQWESTNPIYRGYEFITWAGSL